MDVANVSDSRELRFTIRYKFNTAKSKIQMGKELQQKK